MSTHTGEPSDPFGTARLREATLRSWRDSPTRLTEDTNVERDLRVGAYRDRLFVELAQNAADAAMAAGAPGRVRVSLVDSELRFANTGAPLDARGVASLASLRASGKTGDTVGRFGVGFAAVRTVSDEPSVASATGGVGFSAERTRHAVGTDGDVPVLRLPWPAPADVPAGFDTEVRLPLRDGVDGRALLDELGRDVADLLLALPWLKEFDVDGRVWTREADGDLVAVRGPERETRWLTHRGDVVWAVPVDADGAPRPLEEDVLHAPTPTDDGLSLPARLLASVPVEPSRRRALPGPELVKALEAAAKEYVELVRLLPAEHRFALVPAPAFPKSTVDAKLREEVVEVLSGQAWLSTQDGGEVSGRQGRVLDVDVPGLSALLADLVPGLLEGPAQVLKAVAVQVVGIEAVLETLTGVTRDPGWWREVYAALAIAVESHALAVERLDGLPVPLSDGRTLPGARGCLLVDGSAELLDLLSDVDIPGLRLVHPAASHPLLERLGAKHADARELLNADQLRDAVERSAEDVRSGLDGTTLAGAVLRLIADCGDDAPRWVGALALPGTDTWRRADELVLPASPLLDIFDEEVFEEDGAMDVLDEDFAEDWPPSTLVAAGVLDSFAVVVDDEPHEPDHDLPDEEAWWDSLPEPPSTLVAIRDLDLVADDAWPAAIRLLAARPETWHALRAPRGHAAWWIAQYAVLDGAAPNEWRLPDADLAGLFDEVPDVGLSEELLRITGVRAGLGLSGVDEARDVLDRLADPDRVISPGLAARAYDAVVESGLEPGVPRAVRAADGSVVDDALVLDVPWVAGALEPDRYVVAPEDPERLADLLDLPLASGALAEVTSEGEYAPWAELPALKLVADQLGIRLPDGGVLVHDPLTVRIEGAEHDVQWWSDDRLHAADTSEGLARAFAWAAGRWPDRHLITALLDDPSPRTLLA
ncbi:sacsin N-terminal ATP-binding-like domain-containing protein [Amycolatopsis sp.]|uniref:sacsin N-terminal ATP-binding-like domain-containing protein n=1 Tax=Amycolatopsis sp. TaxID=37632 RepID=UPI002D7E43DD|nr:molecular chaperone Hsp90 [Amycolatopsis sp.]HET6705001.1 molecular chaperone Hsp90 [Amycolatopsis sp.]